MSAPAVHIPSPRRPVGVTGPAPRATDRGRTHRPAVPAPREAPRHAARADVGHPTARAAAGRHRVATAGLRGQAVEPSARAFVVLARAGTLTTLAAMVVLAAALAGMADGTPPTGPSAEVATATLR